MRFRHLGTFLWIAVFLLAAELALEARAVRRGWPTLLLGGGLHDSVPGEWGPTEDFPFRSRFLLPQREDGERRVWVASSSYAVDTPLPIEELFPTILSELLSQKGERTEVLNASFDGLSITQNAEALRELGPTYAPDVALLYQMSNDVNEICVALAAGQVEGAPKGNEPQAPARAIQKLVESTTVYQNLKSQVSARLTKGRCLEHELGAEGEEIFASYVREFLDAARAVQAVPVLVTFATGYDVRSDLAAMPRETEYNLLRFNYILSIHGWLDSIERYNRVLERIAVEEGVLLIDLAGPMSGRPELFRDLWHLSPEGHRFAAETIAEALANGLDEARRGT